MATAPPTISALPTPPDPNDRSTFNARAYPWSVAQQTLATQANAVAANVYSNAQAAEAGASTANTKAVEASASATSASGSATTATDKAGEASNSASSAETSRIEASKLNLGPKAVAPVVDNQGGALLTGATYYDTALGRWRVWSGAVWGDGVSVGSGAVASQINAATAKPAPAYADELGYLSSATGFSLVRMTWANLKTWLGGLFVGKTGAQSMTDVLTAGGLLSNAGVIGYGPGAGGTVTQPASDGYGNVGKASLVTLNKPSGVITTQADSLWPGQSVLFDSINTFAYGCVCVATVDSSTPEYWNYKVDAVAAANGRITFRLTNMATVSLASNVVIKFALLNIATT